MGKKKEIIQHHEEMDFEALYKDIEAQYVGIDFRDFDLFMRREGEKHSFIGIDDGKDGIRKALDKVIENTECKDLLKKASAVMITILRSSKSERPLHIKGIDSLNEFLATLPPECDATWGIDFDDTLGNDIKVILLINSTSTSRLESHAEGAEEQGAQRESCSDELDPTDSTRRDRPASRRPENAEKATQLPQLWISKI